MADAFYLIVGLGNPGDKYDGTRHNVGFEVIDRLIDTYHLDGPRKFGKSLIGKGMIEGQKVIVMKPQTYMNLSGEAVREGVDFFKINTADHLIVLSDDIDLAEGRLRLRQKGSAGGHNGLKNIIQHLGGSQDFLRVRIGVGAKPNPDFDLADYVLGHPTGEDKEILDKAKDRAADAVAAIIADGMEKAMCKFNV